MKLIDGDRLKKEIHENDIMGGLNYAWYIDHAESVDAVEVVHGEWIHGREIGKEWNCGYWITYFEDWHCSNCGVVFEQESKPKYHFCPNCGASMDGEVKHE